MGSDHEAGIRASVGAHHDLGSGYDDTVMVLLNWAAIAIVNIADARRC